MLGGIVDVRQQHREADARSLTPTRPVVHVTILNRSLMCDNYRQTAQRRCTAQHLKNDHNMHIRAIKTNLYAIHSEKGSAMGRGVDTGGDGRMDGLCWS